MTDHDPTQRFDTPATNESAAAEPPPPEPVLPPAPSGVDAVATAPGPATSSARPGRSRLRWLVAAVVILLVAGAVAGATLLLTGRPGDPGVLSWAPADSLVYAEARLDLPGNQKAELAKALAAFPGFDDQAAFPAKLNEALDTLVGKASNGKVSYRTDIDPWFGGQVAFSVAKLPKASDPASTRAVLLVGVKDGTKASAWVAKLLAESGATSTTESYGGTTITVVTPPTGAGAGLGAVKGAYAVVGPVLALGDLDSVKAVIDTKGTAGLPTNEQFRTANASVSGDRLGFVYVNLRTLLDGFIALAPAGASSQLPKALLDQVPAWMVETFRAQDSALVMDSRGPHSELGGTSAASRLPALVPASTIALVDGHDLGAELKKMKDLYGDVPAYKDLIKQIDDGLALIGGFDAATGWMGESGIAISATGDTVTGGIVVVPTDKAGAERLFTQLKGFIQLGGGQMGLKVSEEDYKGTPITVIDLSGLGALAGSMAPGVQVPADIKLAYAVTDQVVVLGYGTDFVKAVLDARTGDSLATSVRFKDALARVGANHTGLMWVDIAAVRGIVERLLPTDAKAAYESGVKPYLDAFDYVIEASVPGTPYDGATIVLHVAGH